MLYNLENLSWQEFEELVKFYLKEKIGEGLWVFDGSQDMGRDAAFTGTANEYPSKSSPYSGNWIFQVKHRITRSKTIASVESELIKTLSKELEKIFSKHNFHCDTYVYITNLNVSNNYRVEALNVFNNYCQSKGLIDVNFHVIEYKDLEVYISNNKTVRYSFPSLLSYTDIEKVFLKKEEVKNKGYIKSVLGRINNFVSTKHYLEAVRRIDNNNFLMLIGNPKCGKTSIVEAISVYFLQVGHYKPYFIRNTDEFFTIISLLPEGESAIFICDDIFGKHDLDPNKLMEWTDYFQSVMGVIESNRKFIFTTRQYIYEEFANKSGLRAFFPTVQDPTRYVVRVHELTEEERDQILEKHLQNSNLPYEKVEIVRKLKTKIVNCKDFSPEVIRSLIPLVINANITETHQVISQHIQQPNQYLFEFFNNIDIKKRLLLLSIIVALTPETNDVESTFLNMLQDVNEKPETIFPTFIEEIEGSIIKRIEFQESSEVEYYHPTMYDVILSICKKDGYYRNLLMKNVNLELLFLLTLRKPGEEAIKVQVLPDEFKTLIQGIERFLLHEKNLRNVARLLEWINIIASEIPYAPTTLQPFNLIRNYINTEVSTIDFYNLHKTEPVENWIFVLDKLTLLPNPKQTQYETLLEEIYRKYNSYDYWRLLFLIENINEGFIRKKVSEARLSEFIQHIATVVSGLRLGINLREGRPKTNESWYPLFRETNDLITKMKKTGIGNKIIENYLYQDWQEVKKYSEFAKNRHSGMIKSGYWKPYKPLRNFSTFPTWI